MVTSFPVSLFSPATCISVIITALRTAEINRNEIVNDPQNQSVRLQVILFMGDL